MWLRSNSISLEGHGSKIHNVSRCRSAVSNESILKIRKEFFFTEVASVQSISNIVLSEFWLMLLFWMFSSSYTANYFFVKQIIVSNVIFFNTKFEYLHTFFGWERGHQLSTYATAGGWGLENKKVSPKLLAEE